jgi:hypothetical protein
MSTARFFLSRKEAQKAQKLEALDCVLEDVFPNFVFPAAKVNEKTVLDSTRAEVAKKLRDIFVVERLGGFDFNQQRLGDIKVRPKVAEDGPVFVVHRQRELGFDLEAVFAQPMQQRVLVDFFDVSVPVKAVNRKSRFAHDVTQFEDFLSIHSSFSLFEPFEPFCGQSL